MQGGDRDVIRFGPRPEFNSCPAGVPHTSGEQRRGGNQLVVARVHARDYGEATVWRVCVRHARSPSLRAVATPPSTEHGPGPGSGAAAWSDT
jgi:hypothetical protein